jgi:hypothetical protein
MAFDEWERRILQQPGADERVRSIEAELREATAIRELTTEEFNELFRDAPPPTVDASRSPSTAAASTRRKRFWHSSPSSMLSGGMKPAPWAIRRSLFV